MKIYNILIFKFINNELISGKDIHVKSLENNFYNFEILYLRKQLTLQFVKFIVIYVLEFYYQICYAKTYYCNLFIRF